MITIKFNRFNKMAKIHVRIDIQQKIKKMDNKIIKEEGTLLETQAIIFRHQRKIIKYFHNQRKIVFLNKCSNNT